MPKLRHVFRLPLKRPRQQREGVAATEFALIAPIMITVLLAVFDIGNALQLNIRLEAAARSALGYTHVYSQNSNNIRDIVLNALNGWNNVNVTVPSMTCQCAVPASNNVDNSQTNCGNSCTGAFNEQRRFISVTTTLAYNGVLFLRNRNLVGNVSMRIQ